LRFFASSTFFELGNEALGRHDVRVRFRVLHAQLVQALLDDADAAVDFRVFRHRFDHALHGRRVFARDLALDGIAGLLRFEEFELGLVQAVRQFRHVRAVVAAGARQHAQVLDLEILERVFSDDQFFFIGLDLVVDELDRFFRILLLAAEAAFDEDRQQRLDDILAQLRVRIVIGNRVDVVALGADDLDLVHQVVDELFMVFRRLRLDVDIDHAHDALDVRAADQGAAHESDLLVHVRNRRHAGQQGLQDALGIDVDPGRSLVVIGQAVDDDPADDGHDPGNDDRIPAVFPDRLQEVSQ
jgi:hypothetical protein